VEPFFLLGISHTDDQDIGPGVADLCDDGVDFIWAEISGVGAGNGEVGFYFDEILGGFGGEAATVATGAQEQRHVKSGSADDAAYILANAETVIQSQARDIEQISQYANSIMAARMLTRSQLVTGLTGMIVTALLSTLALIATLAKP
jgi:hypothetical protein